MRWHGRHTLLRVAVCVAVHGCSAGDVSPDAATRADAARTGSDASFDAAVDAADLDVLADEPIGDATPEHDGPSGTTDTSTDASTDTSTDASVDAGPFEVVVSRPGEFFVPTPTATVDRINVPSGAGVITRIRVAFDVLSGGWQPEIPDMFNRQEHILFGLLRGMERMSWRRYLMGTSAVNRRGFTPNYVMYSREAFVNSNADYVKDADPRYRWEVDTLYHVDCTLDGIAREQHCSLGRAGATVTRRDALIPWVVPEMHLATGFVLELSLETANKGESPTIGWRYSNLVVSVTRR